jgi:hypothetical protein
VKTLEDHLNDVRLLKKNGMGTNYDVLRVEVQSSEAKSELLNSDDNVSIALLRLGEELGKESENRSVKGKLPVLDASLIKDVTFHENVLNKMNIKIHPVSSQIPNDCEVLVCSGIWIDNPEFLKRNLQYVLLDRNHEDKGIGPELTSEFTLLDKYNTINVYGRK